MGVQSLFSATNIFSLWTLSLVSSTAASAETRRLSNSLVCVDSTSNDENVDLFPHKVEAIYSEHWDISYHNTYKIIQNKQVGVSYLLYQCGTTPPADAHKNHHIVIPVPLQDGIALTQTTDIPHIELLGKRTDISTYMGSTDFVSSPCLKSLILEESVNVLDAFDSASVDNWVQEHPQSIILSNPWTNSSLPGRFIVSESSERSSNKAVFEWHKVFAALYNLEEKGNQIFDETIARYDCVSNNAALIEMDKVKPKILWGYWVDYYDSWSDTRTFGWSLGSCPNYYCEFVEDCSGEFMLPEQGMEGSLDCWGAKCMTDEEFKVFAMDADHWVYPSPDFNTVYETKKNILGDLPVVENSEVYDTYGSGMNTWFEQRMAEFDVVLEDMCEVVGTSTQTNLHKRKWLRNVFTEPFGELGPCEDVEAPLKTQANECVLLSPDDLSRDEVSPNDASPNDKDGMESTSSSVSLKSSKVFGFVTILIALLTYNA